MSSSHIQIAGDLERLLQSHKRLVGPRSRAASITGMHTVLEAFHSERQSTLLARTTGPILDPSWEVEDLSLEDIIITYLALPITSTLPPLQEQRRREVLL